MLVALIAAQMLTYGPAPCRCECDCDCDCPQASSRPPQEIRLNDSFFIGEGGVGPAFAPPIYSGGYVIYQAAGSDFGAARGSGFAGASASARANASANVSVRIIGGGYRPARTHGEGR